MLGIQMETRVSRPLQHSRRLLTSQPVRFPVNDLTGARRSMHRCPAPWLRVASGCCTGSTGWQETQLSAGAHCFVSKLAMTGAPRHCAGHSGLPCPSLQDVLDVRIQCPLSSGCRIYCCEHILQFTGPSALWPRR